MSLHPFKITLFSALTLTLLLSRCKKPDAQFSMDRSEYSAGEQLEIANLSVNAKSQNWEVTGSDGAVWLRSDEKHPNLVLPLMMEDGPCSVTLTAKNTEKRQEATTRNFLVKTVRGYVRVIGANSNKNFMVYADNQYIGTSQYYTSSSEVVQVQLPIGLRFLKIVNTDNGATQTETVAIVEGDETYVTFYP